MKTILDKVPVSGESARHLKGNIMSNLHSAITIVMVLAAIFLPQALIVFFTKERNKHEQEYLPDGR